MADQDTHKKLSVECFNGVWELLEKPDRDDGEDQLMCEMAHASLYHWLKRNDITAENLSIGLWLLSRVYVEIGDGLVAKSYAERCLEQGSNAALAAFYLGYGHEAATRANLALGNRDKAMEHLAKAMELANVVPEKDEKDLLEKDLQELSARLQS
jgi:tetratricopeptide (TPR) repeat protein